MKLGYTVVLVDGDIVFIQNPIPELGKLTHHYDMVTQMDKFQEHNTEFYIVRPTHNILLLFELWNEPMGTIEIRDQVVFNQIVAKFKTAKKT